MNFGIKLQGNMMTFIPKGLTTRCKKSTKQEIELGEFPCSGFVWRRCKKKRKSPVPERTFLSYVLASRLPNRHFLKNVEWFFPSLRH